MLQASRPPAPKGERTRTRLLGATRRLAGQVGIAQLNVQSICAAADLGRTSFYTYFPDAQAVVDALAAETTSDLANRFNAAHSDMPRGLPRLEHCLSEMLQLTRSDPETARFVAALTQASDQVKTLVSSEILAELSAANTANAPLLADYLTLSFIALFTEFATGTRPADQIPDMVAFLMTAT